MGGYGSTRWRHHQRKDTVEECLTLCIKVFMNAPTWGIVHWRKVGGRIGYRVYRNDSETITSIRLEYIFNKLNEYDYVVRVIQVQNSWGAFRNWFLCPECSSRTIKLYQPPGIGQFACRRCHKLGYDSQLGIGVSLLKNLMDPNSLAKYPGLTLNELAILNYSLLSGQKLPDKIRMKLTKIASDKADYYIQKSLAEYNPYSEYLSEEELCISSGLSTDQLIALKTSRLVVPDHQGKYRPKLLGWAKKLNSMLASGWSVDDIKQWTKVRWEPGNQ